MRALPVLILLFAAGCQISPPDKPSCRPTPPVRLGEKVTFDASGTDPLNVHKYMYDFGDGTEAHWETGAKQTHTFKRVGVFQARVKEECPWYLFFSSWSKPKAVQVIDVDKSYYYGSGLETGDRQ